MKYFSKDGAWFEPTETIRSLANLRLVTACPHGRQYEPSLSIEYGCPQSKEAGKCRVIASYYSPPYEEEENSTETISIRPPQEFLTHAGLDLILDFARSHPAGGLFYLPDDAECLDH